MTYTAETLDFSVLKDCIYVIQVCRFVVQLSMEVIYLWFYTQFLKFAVKLFFSETKHDVNTFWISPPKTFLPRMANIDPYMNTIYYNMRVVVIKSTL